MQKKLTKYNNSGQKYHFLDLENKILKKKCFLAHFKNHILFNFLFIYSDIYVWASILIIHIYKMQCIYLTLIFRSVGRKVWIYCVYLGETERYFMYYIALCNFSQNMYGFLPVALSENYVMKTSRTFQMHLLFRLSCLFVSAVNDSWLTISSLSFGDLWRMSVYSLCFPNHIDSWYAVMQIDFFLHPTIILIYIILLLHPN